MSYWQNRQKQLNSSLETSEEKLKKRLSKFYDAEAVKLEKEIALFYARYGKDNIIEYQKLFDRLSSDDIKLLYERMDDFALKYPDYAYLMPIRENIYKLNRLESLQTSVYIQQIEIGARTNEEIEQHLIKQADMYGKATAKTLNQPFNFVNQQAVRKFVNNAWANEKNFSEDIWANSKKLADYLNTDIAQGFARGDSYEKMVKSVRERFDKVSRRDAYRLIFTEGSYVLNESQATTFEKDFKRYKFTVQDGNACEICKGINGVVFNFDERQPGVNFPPMHPWCRCGFEVVVDDWDIWIEEYTSNNVQTTQQAEKIIKRLKNDTNNN